jgi:hypothetical protein
LREVSLSGWVYCGKVGGNVSSNVGGKVGGKAGGKVGYIRRRPA